MDQSARKSKTILILNHNQEFFGTWYRCKNIALGLSAQGYKVIMICASGRDVDLCIRRQKMADGCILITLPRVKYHKFFTGQLLRLFIGVLVVLFSSYDILYSFTVAQPQVSWPTYIAKKIRRKFVVIDWDDLWGGGFGKEHHRIIHSILYWHERWTLNLANVITYVSERLGKEIEVASIEYPKLKKIEKYKIINGATYCNENIYEKDLAKKALGILDENVLLSIGNTYTESIAVLFKSLRFLKETHKEFSLYIVGDFQVPDAYLALFREVEDRIKIVGKVPYTEIFKYMSAAEVLILPMEENDIEEARFPMRFADYLCANRPIVSNAVGEVKFYLEKYEAGLVSPPKSSELLATNIAACLDNPELSKYLSANAAILAKQDLSMKNQILNIVSFLNKSGA